MTVSGEIDSVYFLMFPGWKHEFRGNRWHYATRWARHAPVTLVQASDDPATLRATVEIESRIPNCRILNVPTNGSSECLDMSRALLQLQIISNDMRETRARRPLLWAYDPSYALVFDALPSVARVVHATENYFDFAGLPAPFYTRLEAMVRRADATIAVSDGVAALYRERTGARIDVISNGCDYEFYRAGGHDAELGAASAGFEKTAIYAGNINDRLDIELVEHLCGHSPETFFAFYGGESGLSETDLARWNALRDFANFRYFGAVTPDRLPALYATAHLGVAPYKRRPDLTRNLFPLKIYEMLAAGLPVVSAAFDSLGDRESAALRLASSAGTFLDLSKQMDRRKLSAEVVSKIAKQCAAEDYEQKFEAMRRLLGDRVHPSPQSSLMGMLGAATIDDLATSLGSIESIQAYVNPARQLYRAAVGSIRRRIAGRIATLVKGPSSSRRS